MEGLLATCQLFPVCARLRISGNSRAIQRFYLVAKRLVFEWLNRRNQKTPFTWEGFEAYLKHYPLPEPRIVLQRERAQQTPALVVD